MTGTRLLFGPVGIAGLVLSALSGTVSLWALWLALQTRYPAVWALFGSTILLCCGLIWVVARSVVVVTPRGIVVPGSPEIPHDKITAVVLAVPSGTGGKAQRRDPVLERARGRAVEAVVLDGLRGSLHSTRLQRQATRLAEAAQCELRVEEPPQHQNRSRGHAAHAVARRGI